MIVVLHRRRDKTVILRVLVLFRVVAVLLKLPVDEKPLHPPVPNTAGVAGQIHTLGKLVHAAQTAAQEVKRTLGKLGCLIDEDPVVFQAVVLVLRRVPTPMAELNR